MSKVEKFARIIVKRTIVPGLSASTAPTNDHTLLPAWSTSDVYIGEYFLNEVDEKLWIRVNQNSIRRILFEGDVVTGTTVLSLGELTDVNIQSGLTDGQILVYSAGTWYNQNNISVSSLSGLTDVDISGLTTGDILVYNGTNWVNSAFTFSIEVSGITFAPNTGIEYQGVSNVAQTIYNTLLDPSLQVPSTVGGISAGTTAYSLSGKTIVGIIDDLLFPTILPTYTIPAISITSPIGLTQEVGITVTPVLTTTGTKNDAGNFTSTRLYKNLSLTATTASSALTYTDTLIIPITISTSPSTTIYNGKGDYLSGLTKNDNKGNVDVRPYAIRSVNAPQSGDTGFTSSNITINGWYPYFYGTGITSLTPSQVSSIISGTTQFTKVVADSSGTLTMNFNATGAWPWFAIFNPFPNKTIWYEDALNNGNIGTSVTDLFSSGTTISVNSPSGYWNGINYKIYVAQKVTTLGTCQIRVS